MTRTHVAVAAVVACIVLVLAAWLNPFADTPAPGPAPAVTEERPACGSPAVEPGDLCVTVMTDDGTLWQSLYESKAVSDAFGAGESMGARIERERVAACFRPGADSPWCDRPYYRGLVEAGLSTSR